jgi:hypothetical protein
VLSMNLATRLPPCLCIVVLLQTSRIHDPTLSETGYSLLLWESFHIDRTIPVLTFSLGKRLVKFPRKTTSHSNPVKNAATHISKRQNFSQLIVLDRLTNLVIQAVILAAVSPLPIDSPNPVYPKSKPTWFNRSGWHTCTTTCTCACAIEVYQSW